MSITSTLAKIPRRPNRDTLASATYDYVIVGGGSAGCALANRLSADPTKPVLVLEAGRRDYKWDVFIHMPAALAFPIGSRFYDWKYESEPEPFMNGRRVYHARGKVLGGSSSINGMIFQRGNPLDYERWGADPGMGTWDYAHCLPYFKKMETLPGRRATTYRGDDGPARARTRAGRQRRCSTRSSTRCSRPATRSPTTSTATAGGLRQVRPQHPSRPPAERGPGLPAPGDAAAEPRRRDCRAFVNRVLFDGTTRDRRRVRRRPRRSRRRVTAGEVILLRRRDQLAAAAAAVAASATPPSCEALGIPVVHDLPGVGEHMQDHLEVYIQHACNAAGVDAAGAEDVEAAVDRVQVAVLPPGPGRDEPLRGAAASCARNDDVEYPNLMFHFLPIAIRYDGSRARCGGARLPGPHRADVHRLARLGEDHLDGPAGQAGAAVQLPVDRRRTGASGSRRSASPGSILDQPAFAPFNGGEISPGPSGRDRRARSSTGSPRTPRPRSTRRARAGWATDDDVGASTR